MGWKHPLAAGSVFLPKKQSKYLPGNIICNNGKMQPLWLFLFWPKIGAAMALVNIPPFMPQPKACAICGVSLAPDKATAGRLDGRGDQAYACVSHFMEVEKLITGWADFAAQEKYNSLIQGYKPPDLGESHA